MVLVVGTVRDGASRYIQNGHQSPLMDNSPTTRHYSTVQYCRIQHTALLETQVPKRLFPVYCVRAVGCTISHLPYLVPGISSLDLAYYWRPSSTTEYY